MKNELQVRVYDVLRRAVEEGIRIGWMRAHKHSEDPAHGVILENIETEVMNQISEVFTFPEVVE